VLELDPRNPQLAARLSAAFGPWRRFAAALQEQMRAALTRIAAAKPISKDLYEIASRSLAPRAGEQ
jgi:aminopeptidase N